MRQDEFQSVKIVLDGETSSRMSSPRALRNQVYKLTELGKLYGDGAVEWCCSTSLYRILHLFFVNVLNTFIAMVEGEVREAEWGGKHGTVPLTIVKSGFLFRGFVPTF